MAISSSSLASPPIAPWPNDANAPDAVGVPAQQRPKTLSTRTVPSADGARARASRMLAAALLAGECSYADAATHMGIDASLVARWCDERREETIGAHRILELPPAVLGHFVRLLTDAAGERSSAVPVEARAYRALAQGGEETAELARCLADGTIDDEERRSLVPVVGRGIEMRVSLLTALREG